MNAKKTIIGGLLIVGGALAIAATAGDDGSLAKFVGTLNAAQGLQAKYTVTQLGKAPQQYTVKLSKPNLAYINSPDELIVADGTTITVYDKSDKTYYTQPQTDVALSSILAGPETSIWAGFFNGKAFSSAADVESQGEMERRGMKLEVVKVSLDPAGASTYTIYIDKADGLAKQAQLDVTVGRNKVTNILNAQSVTLGELGADLFVFNPPAGAEEISLADLQANTWIHDIDEAIKLAKATDRIVLIDFMASWCGPCKMLTRDVFETERFKEMSKQFVLCKIDGDLQPGAMSRFGVNAYPTVVFLNSDGSEAHRFVGYRDLNGFMGEASKVLGN